MSNVPFSWSFCLMDQNHHLYIQVLDDWMLTYIHTHLAWEKATQHTPLLLKVIHPEKPRRKTFFHMEITLQLRDEVANHDSTSVTTLKKTLTVLWKKMTVQLWSSSLFSFQVLTNTSPPARWRTIGATSGLLNSGSKTSGVNWPAQGSNMMKATANVLVGLFLMCGAREGRREE